MARILVIEDNSANLELMNYLLSAGGHEVLTAQDGEEGLARVATPPLVDIVVCDVHMPRLDGYEVARRLKANAALRRIPLVAVTALAMVGDRDKVLAAGFDGYIAKPIDPREFAAQVRAFLPDDLCGAAPVSAVAVAAVPASPTTAGAATGAHILVVDDSPANRELARATLEPYGYRVTAAATVAEARERMEREAFDLVLSDVHMPDDSGLQFLDTLRADPRWRQLPFVLISSSSAWGCRERERGLERGADRFLVRPIDPRKLIDEVAACLASVKE